MSNNQLKKYEKERSRRKTIFEKKKGLVRVRPGGSGHGSTRRVDEVFTPAGLFPYPNQSSH